MPHERAATRLSMILLAGFMILFFNLIRMQIIRADYYRQLSEKNRIRVICLEGARGRLIDRQGALLTTSRLSFNCSVVPREARGKIDESCQVVGAILNRDGQELLDRYSKRRQGLYNTVVIAEDITPAQAVAIEERLDLLPGFLIETRPQREYPLGEAAAHLTGFTGPLKESEVDPLEAYGYRSTDWLGREGLEKNYESYLRGRSGGLQMEVDSRGRYVQALGVKEPKEGKDLQLTIDARLQEFIQSKLGLQKGAVIVMELGEGGILAINSAPSFDPNLFASVKGRKKVGKYLHSPRAPMVNRGIRGKYPPGSIFKIVTALAALGSHRVTVGTTVNCAGSLNIGGTVFHCWNKAGHGPQALAQAFAHSCNVYFYTIGIKAGADAVYEKALALGFNRMSGIDLPEEKEGFVPSREWKRSVLHQAWFDGDTANLAIGQGQLQVTPIQALGMVSAVASGGRLLKPHLVDKIDGVKIVEKHARPSGLSEQDLKAVRAGLNQVVDSDTGTGRLARVEGLSIAGKTGTAQSGQDRTHAWFVGFAPAEHPKVAMVVFVENGGRGGLVAAQLASSVFAWLKGAAYL